MDTLIRINNSLLRKERASDRPRRETRVYAFDRKSSSSQEIQDWREFLLWRQEGRCAGLWIDNGTEEGYHNECSARITQYADLDHIIELRYHGHDERWNCQLLCKECHLEKTTGNAMKKADAIALRDRIRADPTYKPSQSWR